VPAGTPDISLLKDDDDIVLHVDTVDGMMVFS